MWPHHMVPQAQNPSGLLPTGKGTTRLVHTAPLPSYADVQTDWKLYLSEI